MPLRESEDRHLYDSSLREWRDSQMALNSWEEITATLGKEEVWRNMRDRCESKNKKGWQPGRGIKAVQKNFDLNVNNCSNYRVHSCNDWWYVDVNYCCQAAYFSVRFSVNTGWLLAYPQNILPPGFLEHFATYNSLSINVHVCLYLACHLWRLVPRCLAKVFTKLDGSTTAPGLVHSVGLTLSTAKKYSIR